MQYIEYKTIHDSVGKVIHLKMCTELKFDHKNKWYMHKFSVLENETPTFWGDYETQTDHQISAKQPDLVIVMKKKREPTEWSTLPP